MRRGFTLSEVILGLALLAMMALGLLALVLSGIKLSGQNRQSLLSAKLAQQFLENARDRSLTFPAAAQIFDGKAGAAPVAGFPPAPYPKITVGSEEFVLLVKHAQVPGRPGLHSVEVTVSWRDGTHACRLESYFFRD